MQRLPAAPAADQVDDPVDPAEPPDHRVPPPRDRVLVGEVDRAPVPALGIEPEIGDGRIGLTLAAIGPRDDRPRLSEPRRHRGPEPTTDPRDRDHPVREIPRVSHPRILPDAGRRRLRCDLSAYRTDKSQRRGFGAAMNQPADVATGVQIALPWWTSLPVRRRQPEFFAAGAVLDFDAVARPLVHHDVRSVLWLDGRSRRVGVVARGSRPAVRGASLLDRHAGRGGVASSRRLGVPRPRWPVAWVEWI